MGLLDGLNMNDPQTMGLLGAAAQMLQASGPSLMPHSFGQVMGAGLGGYQQGQQQGLDRQKEKMQMDMLAQQVAQATRKNALINNFLEANMGGQPQGPQQQAEGAPAPQPLPMGSTDGDGRTISTPGFFPPAAQQQPAPSQGVGAPAGFGGVPSSAIAADLAFGNGANISKFINERNAPTDFTKLLIQAGIDPNSALGRQMTQQQIAKQNNIPLVAGRAGAPMYNPDGTIAAMAPKIPDNAIPQIVNGQVVGVSPLAGAANVEQINAYAGQAGKNQAEPMAAYDANGNPVYTNKLAAAMGGAAGGQAPDQPVAWNLPEPSPATLKLWQTSAQNGNKDAQLVLNAYAQHKQSQQAQPQALAPALAPGVEKSIGGNVDTMNSDFADLYAANKNAPVTLAILDNIKKLAPSAITGSQADKLAFVNGLLTLGGLQPAKDLASASDLLNKNANMLAINMRLGASGGGSDALQSLAQAANPNSHMQPDAIAKAADEVAGQVRMRQDQYKTLLPYKMSNDVRGYFGAQQKFSSQADPRTYQPDAQASGASPAAKGAPAAGQTFSMLPAAAQFAGKRMRADNGTIYRSDGTKWIKE